MLQLTEQEVGVKTVAGSELVTRKTAHAIVPVSDEPCISYHIEDDLQQIIDAFPTHTFKGHISAEGEETGDLWRLAVQGRRAVRITPRIVWPCDEAA